MGTKAKMTISRAVSILNREKPAFLEGLSPAEVQMVVAKAGVRRYAANGVIDSKRGGMALTDLADFPLRRYPHDFLLPRIWDLRNNLTAYDAAYVALAEVLDATLLTRDRRLAAAAGHRAKIELV